MKCLIPILLFAACTQTPKKPEDIKPKIIEAINKYAVAKLEGFTLDTVIILKIDTLTDCGKTERYWVGLQAKFSRLNSTGDILNQSYKLALQAASLKSSLFGAKDALTKIALDDVEKAEKAANDNLAQMKAVGASMDSLMTIRKAGQCDSVLFRGYMPKIYLSMVNNANGAVSGDSIFIMLDDKFHIIEYMR